jgi:hypothetical protein
MGFVELVVAVAFAFDAGFGEFAQGIEDAGVGQRLVSNVRVELGGVKGHQQGVKPSDSDTEARGVDKVDIFFVDDFIGEVKSEADFLEGGLFAEPIGITTSGMPAGKVVFGDFMAGFGHLFGYEGVRSAIAEHDVKEVTGLAREASDFACAPVK